MSQKRTKSKMLPEFEFKVNVRYDQEFRSRDANQRLRKNHPKVKKIHVKPRDDAKKSRDGNSYVKVIIAAPTRAIAKACFDDGNARVLKRQENNKKSTTRRPTTNSRRPRTNSRKQRTNSRRTSTNSRRPSTNSRKSKKTPPKSKTPSPENTRPIHYFSEDVTSETDWGEFMARCDEYQKKHPEVKVIC